MYSFIHFFIHTHFLSTCTPSPHPVPSCAGDPEATQKWPRQPQVLQSTEGHTCKSRLSWLSPWPHSTLISLSREPHHWSGLPWWPALKCPFWAPSPGHPFTSPVKPGVEPHHVNSSKQKKKAVCCYLHLTLFWKEFDTAAWKLLMGGKGSAISQKWPENKMPFFAYQIKGQDYST